MTPWTKEYRKQILAGVWLYVKIIIAAWLLYGIK